MILTTLVSTEILEAHLSDLDWVVFDCRHGWLRPSAAALSTRRRTFGRTIPASGRGSRRSKTGKNGRHPLPIRMSWRSRTSGGRRETVVAYDAGRHGRRAPVVDAALARASARRGSRRRLGPVGRRGRPRSARAGSAADPIPSWEGRARSTRAPFAALASRRRHDGPGGRPRA